TEEITENRGYNPQGKVYNYSRCNIAIVLADLKPGKYESHLSYKMTSRPHQNLLNLVWASKRQEYPASPYAAESYTVEVQTASKYLRLEKKPANGVTAER